MTRRRLATFLSLLLVVGALAGAGWYFYYRPIPVQVAKPAHDVPVQVFGLGTVEARIVSKVGFRVTGVLNALCADHGDRVPKGTCLAHLDSREQAARVAKAKAGVDQAEASLKRTMANVAKAEANYANAKNINDRRQAMVLKNTVSVEAAETAEAALAVARAELSLAQSDVEVARAASKDARAQEELEKIALDLHTLAAPYDALIIARQKEAGTVLTPGEPVFTIPRRFGCSPTSMKLRRARFGSDSPCRSCCDPSRASATRGA